MELFRALAALVEPPSAAHAPVAASLGLPAVPRADEYTDVLVFQVYPYSSVYLGPDGLLGGDARDRVAGFWRTLGAEPPGEPDHVAALLAGLAQLSDAERTAASPRQAAALRRARHVVFWDHVASWMPPFLSALGRTDHPFYATWARLAEAALAAEAEELGTPVIALPVSPPAPPAGSDQLIGSLLAPARVGFTLTRDDLLRAGAEIGLGCRVGERRFVLRALLAQDASAVLTWLADEARRQAAALATSHLVTARPWRERAAASASWLAARAAEAGEADVVACGEA
jgi:hypothetical protein